MDSPPQGVGLPTACPRAPIATPTNCPPHRESLQREGRRRTACRSSSSSSYPSPSQSSSSSPIAHCHSSSRSPPAGRTPPCLWQRQGGVPARPCPPVASRPRRRGHRHHRRSVPITITIIINVIVVVIVVVVITIIHHRQIAGERLPASRRRTPPCLWEAGRRPHASLPPCGITPREASASSSSESS